MAAADHLRVPRQHGLFNHHGIDLGDGTIAHYLEGREILRSSYQEFCAGGTVNLVIHQNPVSKRRTLQRAMSRIGEQKYNLLFNNCEHFANWCKTGFHRSSQVENFLQSSTSEIVQLSKFIPKIILNGIRALLNQEINGERSKINALALLSKIKQFRIKADKKLEKLLIDINYWIDSQPNSKLKSQNLLQKGQNLADRITALEHLEEKINSFILSSNNQTKKYS